MRLQLYSQTIRGGESHQALFNPSAAARAIYDVPIGTLFSLPQSFRQTITMLSMSSGGCYVYVILPLSSRVGDYLSLVLFVPRQLMITAAADMPSICQGMEQVLRENGDIGQLRHFFEWEYPVLDLVIDADAPANRYACLWMTSDYELSTFLSNPILYRDMIQYTGVFLLPPACHAIIKDAMPKMAPSMLSEPQMRWVVDNTPQTAADSSSKSAPASEQRKTSQNKGKRSYKWLWCLLAGFALGLVLGFAMPELWTKPQPVVKPVVTTDTLPPRDTLPPTDTLPNESGRLEDLESSAQRQPMHVDGAWMDEELFEDDGPGGHDIQESDDYDFDF